MRRTAKIMAAVAIAIASVVGHASAQDTHGSGGTQADGTTQNGVTSYTFTDGSDVQGGHYGPDGTTVQGTLRSRRDTLIHPRLHFMDAMLKSVENL
jgi:hypothetical protein